MSFILCIVYFSTGFSLHVALNRTTMSLTCTSTGGPPTTVTWRKNGVLVEDYLFHQSQRVVNTSIAVYENSLLYSSDLANIVGNLTCFGSNVRGSNEQTVELNGTAGVILYLTISLKILSITIGVSIISDVFSFGRSATVTCISDIEASMIEWLHNGVTFESSSATSTKQLSLTFSHVNDSIHGEVYTCRVTRMSGVKAQQIFTPNVVTGKALAFNNIHFTLRYH